MTLKGWLLLKKGVWQHTAWQLHENWCVNSALVDRENPWSHQSATLLVSPLTQIEFMGDTCRMFPHPRSYYKTIKCFILTADLLSVCTRHVKWALLYIFIICKDEKHFYKIFFFSFFHLVRQMLMVSIIFETAANVFPSLDVWGGSVIFHLITDQSVTEPCLEPWTTLGHIPARHLLSWREETFCLFFRLINSTLSSKNGKEISTLLRLHFLFYAFSWV